MEQEHRYHDEVQCAGGTDPYIQPAWLCMPQIKVENDVGVYRCQAPQYDTSSNHSAGSATDFSQNSGDCTTLYNRNGQSLTASSTSSDYTIIRRVPAALDHDNASYPVQNNSPITQRSITGALSHSSSLTQESTDSTYVVASNEASEDQPANVRMKSNKTHNVPPWYGVSREIVRPQASQPASDKQQGYSTGPDTQGKKGLKNSKPDEYEPKHAFDLTCRNKSPSKEEGGTSNDSQLAVNEDSLSGQIQARSAPKHQTCKICGKVLSSPSSYYVHMKVHSGNKPYVCSICEASFCRKPYLEVHMRTHTGERPFECNTCNKRFTQKSSLNTHKRVHTGERPYSCDICQKTFAVKSYVTAHRWSHVSEKPLGCDHCGLTFTSRSVFAHHIRTHIEQNHECHLCGRTFVKDAYLIRHQNRVHRDSHAPFAETNRSRSPSASPPSMDPSCSSSAS